MRIVRTEGSVHVRDEGKFIRTQMQADGADERGLVHSICGRPVHPLQISASDWQSGRLRRLPVSYGIKKSGWDSKKTSEQAPSAESW
jgi:hypothetical protein